MKIDIFDPSKCHAKGEGLMKAMEDSTAGFKVDTKYAGKGELNVLVEGKTTQPAQSKYQC